MRNKRILALLICVIMAFGCMDGVVYTEEALSNPSEGGDSLLTEKEVASGAIVAEEVSSDKLQAGDQLLVVFDYSKALSRKPTYNKKISLGLMSPYGTQRPGR